MTRTARALRLAYFATALFLEWATIQSAVNGSVWHTLTFATSSVIPLIAWLREGDFADAQRTARADADRAQRLRERAAARDMRGALDDLQDPCCDEWWTSCGFHHGSHCKILRRLV